MKTYCKRIAINDPDIIRKVTYEYIYSKLKDSVYVRFLSEYVKVSFTKMKKTVRNRRSINESVRLASIDLIDKAIELVIKDIISRIENRELNLPPIIRENRYDEVSEKIRDVGIESPIQQCIEHIATYMLKDLYKAKILPHQYASIKGRGQLKGMKELKKWAESDNYSAEVYKKYGKKYHRKMKFFAIVDIRKCYDSIKIDILMKLLRRDIGKNKDLIWLIEAILYSDDTDGLIIGSVLAKDLCNYMMSYVYREISNYYKMRRDKRINFISHRLFYMDDMFLSGSSRRDILKSIQNMSDWLNNKFQLNIKPNYSIKDFSKESIDMMAYVVRYDGSTAIRAKVFTRSRRVFLRANRYSKARLFNLKYARKIVSYYGYYKYTNSSQIKSKLSIYSILRKAKDIISNYDKEMLLQCC